MEKQKSYTFKQLEKFLNEGINWNKCLVVKNEEQECTAVMHVFMENFSDAYQSGDGVLFYSDGETLSANDDDQFLLLDIINF